jgi:hypothetical protein
MDNSKDIFSLALGLMEPWKVEKINIKEVKQGLYKL